MTSLYPGMLFYSTGFNKKSTPLPPEATPSEVDRRLGRMPFNGRPWPKSSPVSTVYDVRNSSTRMIILNNRLSRKPKGSRLRGQSEHNGEIMQPEPQRHMIEEPKINWEHHKKCGMSVSEKFVPLFPPSISASRPDWVNKRQRPAMKFDNGSGVNPNHHIQCQGHMDYDIMRWYNVQRARPRSRTSTREERPMSSPILNDPNLSKGEKRYLSSIARIYSVNDMRAQKQLQYSQLMWKEISKGSYKESDWGKYNRYLNTPRKTQFGPCDQQRLKRSSSTFIDRKDSQSKDSEASRPHTTQTGKEPVKSHRTPVRGNRSTEMKGSSRKGKQRAAGQTKDLTGQPARVESPLILKERKSSVTSLSSLDEKEHESPRKGEAEGSKKSQGQSSSHGNERNLKTSSKESGLEQDSDKSEQNVGTPRAKDENIAVDETRHEGSENSDERSKISARDTDEQRGRPVEYRPTYGERVGEDERSKEDNTSSSENGAAKEMYQKTPWQEKTEETHQGKAKGKETDDGQENALSSLNGSVTDNQEDLTRHSQREGKDRPRSRLGGREQFMVVKKKETENSDDDYSDDDEEGSQRTSGENATDQIRGGHPDQNVTHNANGRSEEHDSGSGPEEKSDEDAKTQLSLRKGAAFSDISSKETEGISSGGRVEMKPVKEEPVTPTEGSSQIKPSDISTIEY